MNVMTMTIVLFAGLYMIGLAFLTAFKPQAAALFLRKFASSARAHYTEQVMRLFAGASMVLHAPMMEFPRVFNLFGWVVTLTTLGLLLMPWQWHQRFAGWATPFAINRLKPLGMAAFALGTLILWATINPLL